MIQTYYETAVQRGNIFLLPNSLVHKINFDSKKVNGNVKAISVEFENGGTIYTVKLSRDVIVSGGQSILPHLSSSIR